MIEIKFIYFDVGGIIIDWRPAFDKISKKGGKTLEEVNDVFHRFAATDISDSNELLTEFNRELGLSYPTYQEFISFYTESFAPIFETHKLMRKLATNYPIGLLSNTEPLVLESSIKLGRIPDIKYAAIIASCYVNYRKPEKEIYEIARKKADVNPENILFIDDLERNLIPARTMGWQTILFDTKKPATSCETITNYLKS